MIGVMDRDDGNQRQVLEPFFGWYKARGND